MLTVLMLFVGLALDAGAVYIKYGLLKRAVDSAAVAAANAFKKNAPGEDVASRKLEMDGAATEALSLQGIYVGTGIGHSGDTNLNVYICDLNGDGYKDGDPAAPSSTVDLKTVDNGAFYSTCPTTVPGTDYPSPRKLVYVTASMNAPTYFLTLIHLDYVTLKTSSVSEAAPLDLLLVVDTSGSMGRETRPGNPNKASLQTYAPGSFNPDASGIGCNWDNSCEPLYDTKQAAKSFISTLFPGYDRVGIISFDVLAYQQTVGGFANIATDPTALNTKVDSIKLHRDAPYGLMWGKWDLDPHDLVNPTNPDDWSGVGSDSNDFNTAPYLQYGADCKPFLLDTGPDTAAGVYQFRWWDSIVEGLDVPNGAIKWKDVYGGAPCDRDLKYDAFDMNADGHYTYDPAGVNGDADLANQFVINALTYQNTFQQLDMASMPSVNDLNTSQVVHDAAAHTLSLVTTCTGCAVRTASDFFKQYGRQNAVWVMVFLSDGVANATDIPMKSQNPTFFYDEDPATHVKLWDIGQYFPNGFCAGSPASPLWWNQLANDWCIEPSPPYPPAAGNTRYCVNENIDRTDPLHPVAVDTCPPGTTHLDSTALHDDMNNRIKYGPFQYAMDMIDRMALQSSSNPKESIGNKIAVYTIGFGSEVTKPKNGLANTAGYNMGAALLRYMAAVGDDGDRTTDPCINADGPGGDAAFPVYGTKQCGNYYYAANGGDLTGVFEDIAKRIQTRISY